MELAIFSSHDNFLGHSDMLYGRIWCPAEENPCWISLKNCRMMYVAKEVMQGAYTVLWSCYTMIAFGSQAWFHIL